MIPALIGAQVGTQVLGGLIGGIASRGDSDKQQAAIDDAYRILANIGYPPETAKELILQQYKEAGQLTPELEQQVDVGHSKVSQIQEDPKLKEAQTQALQLLKSRSQTGVGPEDRAAINQMRQQLATDQEGKRQQILQNMQQRGMGGSGAELIAQLNESQGSANQASAKGDDISALASQRALEALSNYGKMAGDVRTQDFSNASKMAGAEDDFQKFNTQNQIARQTRNVTSQNAAQAANLSNKQNIMNANTTQGNTEIQRQNQARLNDYNNRAGYMQNQAGAKMSQADMYGQRANQTSQNIGNIAGGISSGIGALAQYQMQQDKNKKV